MDLLGAKSILKKVNAVKQVKSGKKGVVRNTLSKIVSGKALTEEKVAEKVREHIDEQKSKKGSKKRKCEESEVREDKVKVCKKSKGKQGKASNRKGKL